MQINVSKRAFVATALMIPAGATLAFVLSGAPSSEVTRSAPRGHEIVLTAAAKNPSVHLEPARAIETPVARPAPAAPATPASSSLASLLGEMRDARESGAETQVAQLQEKLSALVARDPQAALRVCLDLARAGKDEVEVAEALGALGDEPALAALPETLAAILEMAEHDEAAFRRAAALRFAPELVGDDLAAIGRLASAGRRDLDPDVREAAAMALADVSERSPGDVAGAVAKELVASLGKESEGVVRAALIEGVRDTRDPAVAQALLTSLAEDPEPRARLAAAEALGVVAVAQRDHALEVLKDRFGQESDDEVRGAILSSIVRAGRSSAIASLESLRDRAGKLLPDVNDFLTILRSGEDDPAKVLARKETLAVGRESANAPAPHDD